MTSKQREEIRQAATEDAKRTALKQGFPEKITDAAVLEQIASLMRVTATPSDQRRAA